MTVQFKVGTTDYRFKYGYRCNPRLAIKSEGFPAYTVMRLGVREMERLLIDGLVEKGELCIRNVQGIYTVRLISADRQIAYSGDNMLTTLANVLSFLEVQDARKHN